MRMYLFLVFIGAVIVVTCSPNRERNRMHDVLGLQNMSELATSEYVVTKIIKANDNKTWYKAGERKILMTCKASLVAGIDMSKISANDIDISGDEISIVLPRARLLSINIKPEDIRTAYEEISFFRSKFSSEEKNDLASQAEIQIKNSADSLGLLTTAESNATLFVNNFLRRQGFRNIKIRFNNPAPSLN